MIGIHPKLARIWFDKGHEKFKLCFSSDMGKRERSQAQITYGQGLGIDFSSILWVYWA